MFKFVRKLFIQVLVLNLPCFIRLTVSIMDLLSGMMSTGCLDSLRMLYSDSMTVARASALILQGFHFV